MQLAACGLFVRFLVDSDVVYLVSHGHGAVVYRAAVVAAECEVQKDELLAVEGVDAGTISATVDRLGEVDTVEKLAVEIYAYGRLVPIHSPRVELVGPVGIGLKEVRIGYLARIPYGLMPFFAAPCRIGQNVWYAVGVVILHDVDLAVVRPRKGRSQKPYRRPCTFGDGDTRAHLEASVAEGEAAAGVYRRGGIFGVWRLLVPVLAVGVVFGAGASLAASLDGEDAVAAEGVVTLVVLCLVVAFEALLVSPAAGIGTPVRGELVAPDEAVALTAIGVGIASRGLRVHFGCGQQQQKRE